MQRTPHSCVAACAAPVAAALPAPTKVTVAAAASTLLLMDIAIPLSVASRTARTAVVLLRGRGRADKGSVSLRATPRARGVPGHHPGLTLQPPALRPGPGKPGREQAREVASIPPAPIDGRTITRADLSAGPRSPIPGQRQALRRGRE